MNKNIDKKTRLFCPGELYIVSAPSGAGKTSLVNALIQEMPNLKISISHTTRPKRPLEENGIDYYFVTHPEFQTMMKQDVFVESAEVFGQYYGTSRVWLEEQCRLGIDVILEIDWQGARQIRSQFSNTTSIFILPPNIEALLERLTLRHPEDPKIVEKRMPTAKQEMLKYQEYDYLIVNNQFSDALNDLKAIIQANRLRMANQEILQADRIENLIR